jgi:endonuclease/exonuclease/phosphatase family metal-dependent hydrolase
MVRFHLGNAWPDLPLGLCGATLGAVSEESIELDLDDTGVARTLPRPVHQQDEVQQVPYRPVRFCDDDLPRALERSAAWLRSAQEWLGEPLDVIAVHLDYDERAGRPYYEVKLLCNEEDLAGAPIAVRARRAQTAG